jgi:TolB-like protein
VNIAARLEAASPVGGICVSRSVHDHVHGRLGLTFQPIGELTLKNIARPVEAFVLRLDLATETLASAADYAEPSGSTIRSRLMLLTSVGALLILAAAGAAWWFHWSSIGSPVSSGPVATAETNPEAKGSPRNPGSPQAPRLSVVVLPFENLSGDPKDDYLADAITDDLTSDLSHVSGAFVIARSSAYTYRGKATDVRRLNSELGVRYVLTGSVRKLGTRLRVNAQLGSTETGSQLWTDRFDEQLGDIGAGQDDIVTRIGNALGVTMVDIEGARSARERPADPDEFDLILRARSLRNGPRSQPRNEQARTM